MHLLEEERFKDLIIDSLNYLTDLNKINVYGFVIMPNHLHFIWKILAKNGKESPQGSFLKYTAHQFRKILLNENPKKLERFAIYSFNKMHEFWQPDPLATPLYTRSVAIQKLDYIHRNPLAEHWRLAEKASQYKYSSASYYESGKKSFPFQKNLFDEF